jgi:hypothetical protein
MQLTAELIDKGLSCIEQMEKCRSSKPECEKTTDWRNYETMACGRIFAGIMLDNKIVAQGMGEYLRLEAAALKELLTPFGFTSESFGKDFLDECKRLSGFVAPADRLWTAS